MFWINRIFAIKSFPNTKSDHIRLRSDKIVCGKAACLRRKNQPAVHGWSSAVYLWLFVGGAETDTQALGFAFQNGNRNCGRPYREDCIDHGIEYSGIGLLLMGRIEQCSGTIWAPHEVLPGAILRCRSLFCGQPTSAVPDRLNRLSMVNIRRRG